MNVLTFFRSALVGVALAVVACDSGTPPPDTTPPHPLVGRWEQQAETEHTHVVLRDTRSVRDMLSPGEGRLAVRGALTADLAFLADWWWMNPGDPVVVVANQAGRPPGTRGAIQFRMAPVNGNAWLEARAADGTYRHFELQGDQRPELFAVGAERVTVLSAPFFEPGTGQQLTVDGTLSFARRVVEAGREAKVATDTRDQSLPAQVLELRDGGSVLQRQGVTTRTSSWSVGADGKLRLQIDGQASVDYTYQVSASALSLHADLSGYEGQAGQMETRLDVPSGTVTSVRDEVVQQFARR